MITALDAKNFPLPSVTEPNAVRWVVTGPTLTSRQEFTTLVEACTFNKLVDDVFNAGRQKAFQDLRNLIGAS